MGARLMKSKEVMEVGGFLNRWFKNRIDCNKNVLGAITGPPGCLAGDTRLYGQTKTIEELYNESKTFVKTFSITQASKGKKEGGCFYPKKSYSQIIPSGKKEVYEVELDNGEKVRATLDHKFFVMRKGTRIELKLSEIKEGDNLVCYPKDYLTNYYNNARSNTKTATRKRFSHQRECIKCHSPFYIECSPDMYCSKIKSIKKIGTVNTFDLNTPQYENFILDNGILSHNSSKTYDCLSTAESWYRYQFNGEKYPASNVCFSIGELAKKIHYMNKEGKLRKGELFILEEAGANFGNLDFQQKLSKMFNYILQSFRSMNLILLMNLPVLTMLNKSARQLIHVHMVTCGIDYKKKLAKVKPYFHQLSQHTGKSYWKYPRVRINGKVITLQRLSFEIPSQELIDTYEASKKNFVFSLTEDLVNEVDKDEREHLLKIAMSRKGLSEAESIIIDQLANGMTKEQIASERGCSMSNINTILRNAYKKGYDWQKYIEKSKGSTNMQLVDNAPIT